MKFAPFLFVIVLSIFFCCQKEITPVPNDCPPVDTAAILALYQTPVDTAAICSLCQVAVDTAAICSLCQVEPPTKTEILVKQPWQVDEVLRNIAGVNTHYLRGSVNTTGTNYDFIKLTFNSDGTGTYTDENGTTYTMTWQFTSSDEHNMQAIVNTTPTPTTFIWNLVEISENSFQQTTVIEPNGLISDRYTPIP